MTDSRNTHDTASLTSTLLGPDREGIRLIAVSTLHGSATIDDTSDAVSYTHLTLPTILLV